MIATISVKLLPTLIDMFDAIVSVWFFFTMIVLSRPTSSILSRPICWLRSFSTMVFW